MKYNFDEIIDRRGTMATKVEKMPEGSAKDALPLWVADMDFPCAEPILKALHERIDKRIFGYTLYNTDECMNAVLGWFKKRYGWEEKAENLFFCPGIVSAYAVLVNLLTKEGDGIVLQRPVYYPFTIKAEKNGRVIVDNPLIYENGTYRIDYEDLDQKMADPANKVLVFCSPHNPAGRVWTEEELRKVVDICKKHDKWIICDEIHCDLIRKGVTFHPILKAAPDYADRIVVCTAPSKTFNLAGLQISNIFIPNEKLRKAFQTEIDKTGYDEPNALGIVACEAAYRAGEDWLDQLRAYLLKNLNFLRNFLQEKIPQIHLVEPEGTYLVWLDCSELGITGKGLDQFIVDKAGLWLDGGSMFGPSGAAFQRVNIACPRATLELALNKLKAAVDNLE